LMTMPGVGAVDRRAEGERDDRPDTGHGHQSMADRILPGCVPDPLFQDGELIA